MHLIEPARPEELESAFALLYAHYNPDDRKRQIANAMALVLAGELKNDGIFVARDADRIVGALVCTPLSGASALFWVPRVRPEAENSGTSDALVRCALAWSRGRGCKLAQCILAMEDLPAALPLIREGFAHVTQLLYLTHDLTLPDCPGKRLPLELEDYSADNHNEFLAALERTYQGTLDCPELTGKRTLDEVLAGHRHQGGNYRPDLWWLARENGRPVGLVLNTELPDGEGWDLSYLGVVPEARGRGVGRELTLRVIEAANDELVPQLLCAVDSRNHAARQLYAKLGFSEACSREVLLFFFPPLDGA